MCVHRESQTYSHKTWKSISFVMKFCITLLWMPDVDLRLQKEKNIEVAVKHKVENESAGNGIKWRIK